MTVTSAPFECLTFAVSKPGWGTSSLVAALVAPDAYELRLKRIENGAATADEVRPYSLEGACALEKWIRALGFYDESASSERVEGAGSWALTIAFADADDLVQGGTTYPDSFPDLLATMKGLGLPGFRHLDEATFLADFNAPQQVRAAAPTAMPAGLGIPGLEGALGDLLKDPARAESALREQCRNLPASTKQEMLEFIRKTDPDHYDWWRRILLG